MSKFRLLSLLVVGLIALALPACGGGGQGLRVADDPVRVTSTTIPPILSGETLNYVIPLAGGCGGPYVLQVIEGRLPEALELDEANHAITGYLLEDGEFEFTIQVTDTGCTPFSTTSAHFTMTVGVGGITVVDAKKDGDFKGLIPIGEGKTLEGDVYNPDYQAIPAAIFNEYTLIELIVAGGRAPYEVVIYDDPGIPDGPLPLGTSVIPHSTSIAGTPIEEAPVGAFLSTYRITDSVGTVAYFTAYWLIYSPPLIIATTGLCDGQCGEPYMDEMFLAGGIPPFIHEMVDAMDSRTRIDGPACYPGATAPGPDYAATDPGSPPEGVYIEEESGRYRGTPRRRGTFSIYYHVYSTLLPYSARQNGWKTFTFNMAVSDPLWQDPSYTMDPTGFAQSAPYNRIVDIEVGKPYNPDSPPYTEPGLQCLACDGVPHDGLSDHPHLSQIEADPTPEKEGTYDWTADWGIGQPPGVDYTGDGTFYVAEESLLVKQGFQDLGFTATDMALPAIQGVQGQEREDVRFSIGPDVVVVTTSTTSFTGGTGNTYTRNGLGLNDREMTVQILFPYQAGAELKTLVDARDFAGTGSDQHKVPATAGSSTTVATLLTDVDLLRVSTNPTGWWDDCYNLNPRSARGMQHGDANKTWSCYGNGYGYERVYYYRSRYGYSYTQTDRFGTSPESTSVHIPDCSTSDTIVQHNPDKGVYKDGGKLYAFDAEDYFGVFVVREDSKLYVPVAFHKDSATANPWDVICFGDNWNYAYGTSQAITANQIPQMTVSPDGRFGAMKLMTDLARFGGSSSSYAYGYQWTGDDASESKIVIFSLTGEKLWGGLPYKIISTGSTGNSSSGEVLLAPSLTLTNSHLYYVCSNRTYQDAYSWREHYIYRYDVLSGGSSGGFLPSSGDSEWTNTAGDFMQVPNGRLDQFLYKYSYSRSYTYSYRSEIRYSTEPAIYMDSYNAHEGASAPHPFRVSADGNACALIAGKKSTYSPASTSPYGASDWHMHHVWVDYDGGSGPVLYRLSTTRRRCPHGAGRGTRLTEGRDYYTHQWGARTGPTTAFEIQDDGLRVAVVVNRKTGNVFHNRSYSSSYGGYCPYCYYAYGVWNVREDVIAFEPKTGSTWTSTGPSATGEDELEVTGGVFTNSPAIRWKFGALTFTKEKDGLVFWGGFASYGPTYSSTTSYTASYYDSFNFVGSLYSYKFSDGGVRNILAQSDGGANLAVGTAQTTIGNNSLWSAQNTKQGGVIKPVGGFLSENREYFYICTIGALTSSTKRENLRLIGVNVNSLDGSTTASGHDEGEAFALGGWPSRRGFTVQYNTSYLNVQYGTSSPHVAPGSVYGSEVVMAKDSGWVFFAAHYEDSGPSTAGSYYGSLYPTYFNYYYYGPYWGQVAVFDSNVGGDVQVLTNLTESGSSYSNLTRRYMKYIEPTYDGTALAYVYAYKSSYRYYVGNEQERIGYITGLELDAADGDLVGTYDDRPDLAGQGRVSSSVTHDGLLSGLYFAKGSSSNENGKTLYRRDAGAGATNHDYGLTNRRWNVLHAAR